MIPSNDSVGLLSKFVENMNLTYYIRLIAYAILTSCIFLYIFENSTFARFITLHFAPCVERILAEMTEYVHATGEISGDVIFINCTKIEVFANKYTFVLEKLLVKLADLLANCEKL